MTGRKPTRPKCAAIVWPTHDASYVDYPAPAEPRRRSGLLFARRATIRAGHDASREPALRLPRPVNRATGRGAARANGMRIIDEIYLSICIAVGAFAIGKAIWSVVTAVW